MKEKLKKKKLAIVHYWWINNRGGEKVLLQLLKMFPTADVFLHTGRDEIIKKSLPVNYTGNIRYTFIKKLPLSQKYYQKYLPLMPVALEELDLSEYDIVISSESGPAKGIITNPDTIHICYCHSPMRYIWDMYHLYKKDSSFLTRLFFTIISHKLRIWDRLSADRVDYFISNSSFISARIKKFYRRESTIIHPPVDVMKFHPNNARSDFYLYAGQLTKYKRPEDAILAFNKANLPLKVVGGGEDEKRLKKIANNNIQFLGKVSDNDLQTLFQTCKALIFPGKEDFGIVPVEAMAGGAPVIALKEGGILDTVIPGETGILYESAGYENLLKSVLLFEEGGVRLNAQEIHNHSHKFSIDVFNEKINKFMENATRGELN
ncbi:hypothetical protein TH25_01595 [Thalassospira profundimaris]|uniref:Glycosyl transferase family 1 domain-containing protein n=1 Tax=Thalassospira profundimaris TaxID=502049 RepID=A0A367XK78_9PROT|nr:glycosyltransferase [Thalassospira profundimaris]RCK54063.1 hypothetical protein TH25_01595 [Thalassospira profundimaris]